MLDTGVLQLRVEYDALVENGELTGPGLDYFVVTVSSEQRPDALRIAHALRDKGRSVAYALKEQALGKQLKAAGREGAREVLILGPDELARGCVVARDMSSGTEREVALKELA